MDCINANDEVSHTKIANTMSLICELQTKYHCELSIIQKRIEYILGMNSPLTLTCSQEPLRTSKVTPSS